MDKSQGKKDYMRTIFSSKDVKIDEWKGDICKWLQVEYGGIYNYLILHRACDGEEMKWKGSCMAGNSKTCSHVDASFVENWACYKVRFYGKIMYRWADTVEKGATRNLEPGVLKKMDFKKPKCGSEENNNTKKPQNTKLIFQMFVSHQSFKYFVENTGLKELFLKKNYNLK